MLIGIGESTLPLTYEPDKSPVAVSVIENTIVLCAEYYYLSRLIYTLPPTYVVAEIVVLGIILDNYFISLTSDYIYKWFNLDS